jgi:hypothetical protein
MKISGPTGRYTTPAACGYGLRARYSNCQRTVALVFGRLSVPEYSVRVAPRRTFSRQRTTGRSPDHEGTFLQRSAVRANWVSSSVPADSLRQKNVGAAGGRYISPPYPAANELSGIYRTKSARGVDTREVKSRFDHRPLVSRLYVFRLSRCFSNASESSSVGSPPLQQP